MDQNIDLVMCDFDGVLVDHEIWTVQADQRIPADCGWRLTSGKIVEPFLGSRRRPSPPLHSAGYGFPWLACTEALVEETAVTTLRFFGRARVFFAA